MLNYKSSFLLIPILIFLLNFCWKKWLLTIPEPLPKKSSIAVGRSNNILAGHFYEVSIPPTKLDWYSSADYRIWIPDRVKSIRGLIFMQHGCGNDAAATGLEHANDLQWQALALKYQFAILATKVSSGDRPCEFWSLLNSGSETAFFKALHLLAQKSDRPELETVPWVLWGHSGGAEWVSQMLKKYPDRTIAVIAMRGGGYFLIETNSKLLEVPVLFALGEKDPLVYDCVEVPKQVFFRQRKAGAPWAFALEAKAGHEAGDTRLLAIPYLDAILTLRLPAKGNNLLPIDKNQGWLADPVTHKIAPIAYFQGNPLDASWLPNEETARKWEEYVTTGKISPTHKPAAPTNISATKISLKEVLITWSFEPDLENGLPSFRIYRNHSLIQTLQEQKHNSGDTPEPSDVFLEFRDEKASPNSTYTVGAFNQLGESIYQPKQ
jgi:pimeloyl-ACP methyl ester carboxylesterase